jgi:hypothetical protein
MNCFSCSRNKCNNSKNIIKFIFNKYVSYVCFNCFKININSLNKKFKHIYIQVYCYLDYVNFYGCDINTYSSSNRITLIDNYIKIIYEFFDNKVLVLMLLILKYIDFKTLNNNLHNYIPKVLMNHIIKNYIYNENKLIDINL